MDITSLVHRALRNIPLSILEGQYSCIRWAINHSIIDVDNIDVFLDIMLECGFKFDKNKFFKHFSNIDDSKMDSKIIRFSNRMTLNDRWE